MLTLMGDKQLYTEGRGGQTFYLGEGDRNVDGGWEDYDPSEANIPVSEARPPSARARIFRGL